MVAGELPARETDYRVLDRVMDAMDDLHVDLWFGSAARPLDAFGATALRTGVRL